MFLSVFQSFVNSCTCLKRSIVCVVRCVVRCVVAEVVEPSLFRNSFSRGRTSTISLASHVPWCEFHPLFQLDCWLTGASQELVCYSHTFHEKLTLKQLLYSLALSFHGWKKQFETRKEYILNLAHSASSSDLSGS